VGEDVAGIGNETRRPSGNIGLGTPPFAESNPLRLRMIFIVRTRLAAALRALARTVGAKARTLA
jgi:hypothetical protein